MDARDVYARFSRPGQLSPPPSPPRRVSFIRDADIEIFLDGSSGDEASPTVTTLDEAPPGRVPLPVATPLKSEAVDVDLPFKTPRGAQDLGSPLTTPRADRDALRRRIERAIGSPPRTPVHRDDDASSVANSSLASSLVSDSSVASSLISDDERGAMVTVAVYAPDGSTLRVLRVPRSTNRALLAASVARQAGVSPHRCRVVDASPNSAAAERRAARRRRRDARGRKQQPQRRSSFLAGAAMTAALLCLTLAAAPHLQARPTALVVAEGELSGLRAELDALRRDLAQSHADVSSLSKRLEARRPRNAGEDRGLRHVAGGLLDVASLGAVRRAAAARDAAARRRNPGAFTKRY